MSLFFTQLSLTFPILFLIILFLTPLIQTSSLNSGHERIKETNEHETNFYKIQRWRQQNENVLNDPSPISLEEDTAPPETGIVPELSIEKGKPPSLSNKFLKRLSAQQLANQRAKLHRGGNLREPVNFEEALKVTVPYD
uniref:Uncharacterized protein n=1 Tax=Meloidogyne enterolobii TaxID=390850 RepID=A0A6V7VN87_MELEN|nr:unnamed protein product [Meloidogyne enterolobii]